MEPLRVALPLGIGDTHWSCMKLRGLSEHHGGRPIHAFVNKSPNHNSVGFLRIVGHIAQAIEDARAPYSITTELPPHHRDPKWSTLEGCRNWNGFDYVLVANGHLERGERIETWLPEIATEYSYPLNIPDADVAQARHLMGADRVLLYPSGIGPNAGFHGNSWTIRDWVEVIQQLNSHGITPTLIGAPTPDDTGYREWIIRRGERVGGICVNDTVGVTNQPQVLAMIREADAVAGLNSGLMIMAAAMRVPTVMLWANKKYYKNMMDVNPQSLLPEEMARSWLCEDQLHTYRTLDFGSPELTPEALVQNILEVKRT
jgi:hypothetical protein